jgi:hypothetical protein
VAHDFAHGGRPRGIGDDGGLAVFLHAGHEFQIRQFRRVLGDWIIELPLALLIELHQRDAGNRFRHRIDAEERIRGHRRAGRCASRERVAGLDAIGLELRHLAFARQQRDHAGDVLVGHRLGHARIERGETFGGESNRGRIGDGGGRPCRIVGRLGGDGGRVGGLGRVARDKHGEGCSGQKHACGHLP